MPNKITALQMVTSCWTRPPVDRSGPPESIALPSRVGMEKSRMNTIDASQRLMMPLVRKHFDIAIGKEIDICPIVRRLGIFSWRSKQASLKHFDGTPLSVLQAFLGITYRVRVRLVDGLLTEVLVYPSSPSDLGSGIALPSSRARM